MVTYLRLERLPNYTDMYHCYIQAWLHSLRCAKNKPVHDPEMSIGLRVSTHISNSFASMFFIVCVGYIYDISDYIVD